MNTLHVVGDSISMQYGPFLERVVGPWYGYSRKEGEAGNLDVAEGANGGDSGRVREYLEACVAGGRGWGVLVLNCGLHDVKRYGGRLQVGPEAYEGNLGAIFGLGYRLAGRVVWVRTTPVSDGLHRRRQPEFVRHNADVELYNEIADGVARAAGAEVVDLYTFTLALGGDELFEDHVHFTERVRALQAAFLAGHLVGGAGG